MTSQDLKQAQDAFERYRGNRVVAITIPYDEWMRETAVDWTRRTSTTQELDKALKEYHDKGKSQLAGYQLRQAFEKWVCAHPIWWQSDRNRKSAKYPSGIIQALHDQIQLVGSFRYLQQMESGSWESIQAFRKVEKEALKTLFEGRRLIYRNQKWKENVAAAINQLSIPAYSVARAAQNVRVTESGYRSAVTQALGSAPDQLFQHLGVGWDAFVHVMTNILNLATGPAKLLANIVDLILTVRNKSAVRRERFMFSPGMADAALNGLIRLIDRDINVTTVDIGKQVLNIAGAACGGVGAIATTAFTTLVDLQVNMSLYETMRKEMNTGNEMLSHMQTNAQYNLDLFNASPLLGCYFIVMASTAIWLNFDVAYVGIDGFMEEQARMYERAEPVRERARKYIRKSKYVLSGTADAAWELSWKNHKGECLQRLLRGRLDQRGGVDWICEMFQDQRSDRWTPRPLVRQNASRSLQTA